MSPAADLMTGYVNTIPSDATVQDEANIMIRAEPLDFWCQMAINVWCCDQN